ncbi:MAG TPA: Fic family protein [Bacillota bacterium]|jgi:prophage maintenance system killer protein|nr:Fic family protein [Bacillota bacterium]
MDSAVFMTLDEAVAVHTDQVKRYGGHPFIDGNKRTALACALFGSLPA